jgi:hypothetical protein
MGSQRQSIEFTLGGLAVRLTLAGDRWVARAGESVAVAGTARLALAAALQTVSGVTASVLLADLALLPPSIQVAALEQVRSAG